MLKQCLASKNTLTGQELNKLTGQELLHVRPSHFFKHVTHRREPSWSTC